MSGDLQIHPQDPQIPFGCPQCRRHAFHPDDIITPAQPVGWASEDGTQFVPLAITTADPNLLAALSMSNWLLVYQLPLACPVCQQPILWYAPRSMIQAFLRQDRYPAQVWQRWYEMGPISLDELLDFVQVSDQALYQLTGPPAPIRPSRAKLKRRPAETS